MLHRRNEFATSFLFFLSISCYLVFIDESLGGVLDFKFEKIPEVVSQHGSGELRDPGEDLAV